MAFWAHPLRLPPPIPPPSRRCLGLRRTRYLASAHCAAARCLNGRCMFARHERATVVGGGPVIGESRDAGSQAVNIWRGLFRLWLVLSICWVGWNAYANFDELCWTYSFAARQAVEKARSEEINECQRRGGSREGCATEPPEFISVEPVVFPRPPWYARLVGECIPTGDRRLEWEVRLSALRVMLVPPLAGLLIGLVVLWIGRGFRRGR